MKVNLGTLKNKADELATFLEPRVGTKPSLSGDAMEIDDGALRKGVKPRHVKTYIKGFLHRNKLRKNYRVLVQGRELTVQELELGEKEEKERERVKEKLEKAEKEQKQEKEAMEEAFKEKPAETEKAAKEKGETKPEKKEKGGPKKKAKAKA